MKYSKRVATQKLELVRKFTDEANKLVRDDKIYLSIGVPDFPALPTLKEGIDMAFEKGYTNYTATAGMDIVKKAIAKEYEERKTAYPISEKNILVTAGSQEAIFLLALSSDRFMIMSLYTTCDYVPTPIMWYNHPSRINKMRRPK